VGSWTARQRPSASSTSAANAVRHIVEGQRRILREYGVEFDVWSSEHDVREQHLPGARAGRAGVARLSYEQDGALWFRSSEHEEVGDDKDRVLRRSSGGVTYFGVDVAYHHYVKFAGTDRVINLARSDHTATWPAMRGRDAGARPPAGGVSKSRSCSW